MDITGEGYYGKGMTKTTKRGTPAAAVLSNGIRGWRPERSVKCANGHETGGLGCYTCTETRIVANAVAAFFRAWS